MKYSFVIGAVLFSLSVKAQSVISSGGYGGNSAVSYTIGEAIISGGATATSQITQGFQQPNLWGVKLEEQELFELKAYPNPVASYLTLESAFPVEDPYRLFLYSSDGKLILESVLTENAMQLDFSNFSAGTYTLFVNDSEGQVASFRIVKTK
ncbi:T9SS type A sorting domain-containing protein [Schleiferiaceae bacterium]|nr:T9SS type A sorting domain-containing protein [Schleiferiaceae bacterium]